MTIIWYNSIITRRQREIQNSHIACVLWFTGLSGSGKSTLAHAVEEKLYQLNHRTFVLDGDNVRHGLCADLGFDETARKENIRRISETAKLFLEAGVIVLTAFISPFRSDRQRARSVFPHGDFLEIYCQCSLEKCEQRDVKGLYHKARQGEIPHFTGISSPYEPPQKPDLVVDTEHDSLETCIDQVISLLKSKGIT